LLLYECFFFLYTGLECGMPQLHDAWLSQRRFQGEPAATIWMVASPAAIVTTNVLVHDKHQHFPYWILVIQLGVAILLRLGCFAYQGEWPGLDTYLPCNVHRTTLWSRRHGWELCQTVFTITALLASYQAFFHMPSLLCVTMSLALAPACSTIISDLFFRPERYTVVRAILATMCVAGLYLKDYRLSPNGAAVALLSLGAYIAAQLSGSMAQYHRSLLMEEQQQVDDRVMMLMAAVPATIFCAFISETRRNETFDPHYAPYLLAVNAAVGGVTLACGGALFARSEHTERRAPATAGLFEGLIVVGAVFAGWAIAGHYVIVSSWQLATFACICLLACADGRVSQSQDSLDLVSTLRAAARWQKVPGWVDYQREDNEDLRASEDEALLDQENLQDEAPVWQVCRLVVICIAAFSWFVVVMVAGSHSVFIPFRPSLVAPGQDTARSLDLVITYHDESLDQLARNLNALLHLPNVATLDSRLILYAKASKTPLDELSRTLNASIVDISSISVHELPNKGREGETFLHHMLDYRDDLADHTFFAQADMHNPWYLQRRIEQYFVQSTGFLSLWHMESMCTDCDDCRDHSTWSPDAAALKQVFADANNNETCSDFVPTFRGQFIASAERIRNNKKDFYEGLRSRLMDPKEENPAFGYDLERLWGVVLQCPGGRRIADRCPSMASGLLGTVGELEDCQCLDTP